MIDMSQQEFDVSRYKNKNTIYRSLPGVPGISTIWDWSKRLSKYCRRSSGIKFSAVKRVNGRQTTKCFVSQSEAKKWQANNFMELPTEEGLLFKDLRERFLNRKINEVKISTFETLKSKINRLEYFNNMLVADITPRVIDAWLEYAKSPKYLAFQHKSRTSYWHELAALRQIFDYYSEYICEENTYSSPVKKRHKQDCIIDREKSAMIKAKNKKKFLPPLR